jgi:hypothetical protein
VAANTGATPHKFTAVTAVVKQAAADLVLVRFINAPLTEC